MASSSANLWVLLGLGLAGILIMTKKLKRTVRADFGAFIERLQLLPPPQPAPPKAPHPLTGLSFAVSDVFNIEGFITGFGNPDWSRTHDPATRTCHAVAALVDGGATCVGKTVVDDMALGGENKHYGTPTNPAAPARVPGGASMFHIRIMCMFNLQNITGIDTDGGVRLPAGNCAILGFRSSHGTVPLSGVIPVSGSLDTVGWFAKDPSVLRRVGHVLLQIPYAAQRNPRNFVIADDCFQLSKVPADRVTQVVIKSIEKLYGRQVLKHQNLSDYIKLKVPSLKSFSVLQANGDGRSSPLRLLANVMHIIKSHEFCQNHNEWINTVKPTFDPVISAQIPEVLDSTDADIEKCHTIRSELRSAINALLKDDGILVIPTATDPPPKLEAKEIFSEEYLIQASTLSSVASLSGCCQVAVPLGVHEKCPVSLSLLARHGGDRFLLDTLQVMYASLQEQVDTASKPNVSSKAMTNEESADMAKEKGNQAFKEKQWQRAIGFYTEAIKLNGSNATYYANRAAAYLEIGSYIQADADCSQTIDLDKKNVKAYLRRGTAREMLGYYREAMEDFGYALVLEPNNKRAAQTLERLRKYFSSS
ncbi:translocon at the outer membrane of chloroplasts 64-III [Perilla frutescens var. hirtella]|uniref:Translocon at the outer membrane of chloroplasts 64-III n=1 Tax=Perilla frutescens var. hirtella TaxID=608512 RepID=A0AAD4J242_PERFH|nr:translocon at the outer membrane of chloroplasts 64-III [Perilla frutescens var. hirtella]KAH6825785.1 translocon at the outer membrane of chloroplasts 64-III [Perilla frutescens var. hirtella]